MITFFPIYAKACGLSPTIFCFSWCKPDSVCVRVLQTSQLGGQRAALKENPRTGYFCSMSILFPIMALSTVGPEGVGASDNLLFGLVPSITKEHFFLPCWGICKHTSASGWPWILLSWPIWIQVYWKLVGLLFLGPAEFILFFPLWSSLRPKQFRAGSLKGILFLKWAVCKIVDLLTLHWQTLSGLI